MYIKFLYCKLVFCTLIILSFTKTLAQTLIIKGTISDKQTGIVLENAFVNIDKTNNHSYSDDKGNFFFINIPIGTYELEFEKVGYEKQVAKLKLSSTDTITLNILLVSKSIALTEVAIATDRPVSAASSSYLSQINFANRPKNSAQDLLRLVPGLFIAQHAGGGKAEQIFIRGFDCDHGTDIATFVDGIPVNMPSHAHGQGYADLHFLIPEVVESMNVFKGTYSALYGDFATGAAVGFKTLDSLPNNLIQLEAGSVPTTNPITSTRGLALLKVPIGSSNVSCYFAADVINNNGYFNINQDFKRTSLFSKTTVQINDNSRIQFSAYGFGSSWNASGQIPERAVAAGLISRFGSIDPNEAERHDAIIIA